MQSQCLKGRSGQLKKPTYLRSAGERSRGNQRESLQYGGFFDFNTARPGKRGLVPDFPPILHRLVNLLIHDGYIDDAVRPDSCIINQYGKGDCIPPHIDHESYFRPISTLSLLGEESMLVGTKFQLLKSCTWKPVVGSAIPLPRRSLLLLGGNAGNVSKHCISSCKGTRISITLRKQSLQDDWRPSFSDELSKGSGGEKRKKSYVTTTTTTTTAAAAAAAASAIGKSGESSGASSTKRKALSGSAKRRKKIMKLKKGDNLESQGGDDVVAKQQQKQQQQQQNQQQTQSSNSSGKKATTKRRSRENQARRNARRLEKKQKQISVPIL